MEYEPHDCGGKIIDLPASYIPLGTDNVLEIIDQKCEKCGAVIVGKYQKKRMFKNQKAHDKLLAFYEEHLH